MRAELRALSIGHRAAKLLASHSDWAIAAVFDRSFYLRCGAAFVCVGEPSIGNGPLNAIVPRLPSMSIGAMCDVDTSTAAIWQASTPPAAVEVTGIGAVTERAWATAPPDSLIHSLHEAPPQSSLDRRARDGMSALRSGDFSAGVSTLAGLGHGLTPSGDDVLAGMLLMLQALSERERAARLADAVRHIAPALTSPLSFALLEPACDGEPSEPVEHAIMALLAAKPPDAVLHHLAQVGATSGFDILAGMLIAAGA